MELRLFFWKFFPFYKYADLRLKILRNYDRINKKILLLFPFLRNGRSLDARILFCRCGQPDCGSGYLSERFFLGMIKKWRKNSIF